MEVWTVGLPAQQLSIYPRLASLNACGHMDQWFFAFGHTNYARWMPVFLKNMARLPICPWGFHKSLLCNVVTRRPPFGMKVVEYMVSKMKTSYSNSENPNDYGALKSLRLSVSTNRPIVRSSRVVCCGPEQFPQGHHCGAGYSSQSFQWKGPRSHHLRHWRSPWIRRLLVASKRL